MANFADDTAVEPTASDTFRGTLTSTWSVWGPNGGYLAALALRAAGAYAPRTAPASMSCQFLAVARYGEVTMRVVPLRGTRRARNLQVTMSQRGRPVLTAQVWTVADGLTGPEQAWMAPPPLPAPDALPTLVELMRRDGLPVLPIWEDGFEIRLTGWREGEWSPQRSGVPTARGWMRLHEPLPAGADPWLAAGRVAFAADIVQFPAVVQAFDRTTFMAPSMDLYVGFHASAPADGWLHVEGEAAAAGGGVLGARARVWSERGHLLATGGQQMLHRQADPA